MTNEIQYVYFNNRNELRDRLTSTIKHKLGYNIFVSSEPNLEEKRDYAVLGACIPEIIDDSRSNERFVKFLNFDSIGVVEIKRDSDAFRAFLPNTDELVKAVTNHTSKLIDNVEKTLLDNTYSKLVEIASIQNALTPIRTILNDLRVNNESTLERLTKDRPEKRILQYVTFLESLELVEHKDSQITQGKQFIRFEGELNNKSTKELYNRLLTYIMQNGFNYMREYLKLTAMTPYVRWATSYYLPSSQKGDLLHLSHNALMLNHSNIYKETKVKNTRASNQITNLVDADIFEEEGRFIVGKENILRSSQIVVNKLS